ncbi:MAG: hypothetical protein ACOYVD_19090 [Bacillota bacterium]
MELINRSKSVLILTFIVLFLINTFAPSLLLNNILAVIVVLVMAVNLPFLKGSSRYISICLLIISLVIMLSIDAGISEWRAGLNKNVGIVSLLVTVPMLSFPLYYDNFQKAIVQISTKYLNTSFNFYSVTSLLSYSLGIFLNVASMNITYHLLEESKERYPISIFSSALTRGFNSCSIWSPNFVGVAVILEYLNLPWIKMAPIGFLLSLTTLLFSIKYEQLIERVKPKSSEKTSYQGWKNSLVTEDRKLLFRLASIGILLILLIIITEILTGLSVLVIVPIIAFLAPFMLALLWGKGHVYKHCFNNYLWGKLPKMENEIVLFLTAGLFGQAVNSTNVGSYAVNFINSLNIQHGSILITILMLIIVLLSLLGIHPVVTTSTIALTLPISQVPLVPIQYTLTLLTAYAVAALLSPISGTVLVAAGIFKENPFNIGIGWNWKYSCSLMVLYIVLLSMIPI